MNQSFFNDQQEDLFRLILWSTLALYMALGMGVGFVKVKPPAPPDVTKLPPRITRLIVPPKPVEPPKPEVKPEEAPPEEKVESEKKEPEPEKVEVASKPELSPEEIAEQQRRRDLDIAMNSGLLSLLKQSDTKPLSDKRLDKTFSEIKGLKRKRADASRPGMSLKSAQASGGIDDIVDQLEKLLQNSKVIVSDKEFGTSGGIATPDTAPKIEVALKERKTTAVKNPFQIKGYADGDSPRTYEEISEVVEKYKAGVSFIYNRALRKNPGLRGTVTTEFTISAIGDVIDAKVVTSSMENSSFEESLLQRILQWKFPPIPVGDVTVVYPIVFYVTG